MDLLKMWRRGKFVLYMAGPRCLRNGVSDAGKGNWDSHVCVAATTRAAWFLAALIHKRCSPAFKGSEGRRWGHSLHSSQSLPRRRREGIGRRLQFEFLRRLRAFTTKAVDNRRKKEYPLFFPRIAPSPW
jgi:hypothetical protein